jgi:hypothetical protein
VASAAGHRLMISGTPSSSQPSSPKIHHVAHVLNEARIEQDWNRRSEEVSMRAARVIESVLHRRT